MRGFLSFLVVLAFAALMLSLAEVRASAATAVDERVGEVLALEKSYYAGLGVKAGFSQVLSSSASAEEAAWKLKEFEEFAESPSVELWFGFVSQTGVDEMKAAAFEEKKPVKCGKCLDFSFIAVDLDGRPVPLSAALLFFSGGMKVSRSGLSLVPGAEKLLGAFAGEPMLGATYYSDGVASVFLLPEVP